MGRLLVILVCFYAINAIDHAVAVKIKQRVRVLESRIKTLELQDDVNVQAILSNTESITKLNETIVDMDQCSLDAQDADSNSDNTIGRSKMVEDRDTHALKIVRAFGKEKQYIRKYEQGINKMLTSFKNDIEKTVAEGHSTMNDMKENIASTVDDLQASLNTSLEILKQETTEDIESLQNHTEYLQGHIESLQSNYETVVAEQTNLKAIVNEVKLYTSREIDSLNNLKLKVCRSGSGFSTTKFNGYLYKYVAEEVNYAEAKQACADCGGHVVDVQDQGEMTFIMELVGQKTRFWLGATDTLTEGKWVWDRTGVEATYTNWRPGQPDISGSQDCLVAGNGSPYDQWNDWPCGYKEHYVCKYKPA